MYETVKVDGAGMFYNFLFTVQQPSREVKIGGAAALPYFPSTVGQKWLKNEIAEIFRSRRLPVTSESTILHKVGFLKIDFYVFRGAFELKLFFNTFIIRL